MNKPNQLPSRQVVERELVTGLKHNDVYEKLTDPVFLTDVGFVTLTFDDGPSLHHTESLLEILANKRARAIFFMLGENVAKYPQLARKVLEQGHVIGNHTYSHVYMTKVSAVEAKQQLGRTSKLIADTTGIVPTYFRPPYGAFNESTILYATQERMKVVMYSADPRDYSYNTGNAVYRAASPLLASRNILLLHDLKQVTVDALPRIIDAIRENNLQTTVQYEH